MREYKIKKGHNVDLQDLVHRYFGIKGDVEKGFKFDAGAIGIVFIQKKGSSLFIDVEPSREKCSDFSVIRRWNDFCLLYTSPSPRDS